MQQPLIKANVGPNMDNHVGLLQTVLQRYWKVQGPVYTILQNIFQQILRQHNKLYKSTDKIHRPSGRFVLSSHRTLHHSFWCFGVGEKQKTHQMVRFLTGSLCRNAKASPKSQISNGFRQSIYQPASPTFFISMQRYNCISRALIIRCLLDVRIDNKWICVILHAIWLIKTK